MRLNILTSQNTEIVPFNYLPKLVGVLHKWIGLNELHGIPSLYSFSWLMNAKAEEKGLQFPNGANFFISFHEEKNIKQIIRTLLDDPAVCYGMKVTEVSIQENPNLSNISSFFCGSPIFIKRHEEENILHYTYEHKKSGDLLKETLLHKMRIAGLEKDETLQIKFDLSFRKKKIKVIDYRGIKNKASLCPVIIEGKPETKLFAWNVGLGNSTGIGFGAIY